MTKSLIYLDNAATVWPKPENVYRFMDQFYRTHGVNPGRSGYDLAIETGSLLQRLRERLTRFFGGDEDTPERLVFSYNVSDALNIIIPGLLRPGDHVISTNLEHNSVIRPLNHMARDQGIEATFLPFNGAGFVEPDQVAAAMRPNTRMVIVNHGSNVIGTVQPIGEIGRICREHGASFVVDTAQTAGVVPIDMKAMNIDVAAFTGHKALMGCMGIGGLCIRKHVSVRPVRSGGTGVKSEYPYQPEEYPWRLECGTPNLVGVASLWAGQDWIEEQGLENIHEREMKLTARLVAGLRQIEGVRLYCCDNLRHHIPTVLMNLEGIDAGNIGTLLDVDHEIAVRTGLHCAPLVHKQLGTIAIQGGVRFSIGAFNTMEHVEAAIAAIGEISRWARERRQKTMAGELAASAATGKP
jgi:cysteine desulfurase family protein